MKDVKEVKKAIEQLEFQPNDQQRKLKARFWSLYSADPYIEPKLLNLEHVLEFTKDHRAERWWAVPGFKIWFLNDKEHEERLAYLYHLALDSLEEILLSDDPKMSSARVNAIRLVAELGNKMPSKSTGKEFSDKQINDMSKQQLEEFISTQSKRLGLTLNQIQTTLGFEEETRLHDNPEKQKEN